MEAKIKFLADAYINSAKEADERGLYLTKLFPEERKIVKNQVEPIISSIKELREKLTNIQYTYFIDGDNENTIKELGKVGRFFNTSGAISSLEFSITYLNRLVRSLEGYYKTRIKENRS